MAHTVSKLGVKVLTIAVGIPVGILTKRAVEKAWTVVGPQDDERAGGRSRQRISDAAGYAALTAAATVVAQALSRRGGEKAWHAITGLEPPPAPLSKQEKKAAKAARREGEVAGVASGAAAAAEG